MNLYLKEPTIEDKYEVLQMCKELSECGDEYPFEGAGRLDELLNKLGFDKNRPATDNSKAAKLFGIVKE